MNTAVVAALAALAGGFVAGAVVVWRTDAATLAPPTGESVPGERSAAAPALDLTPVVARLAALDERLRGIEQRLDAAPAATAPFREPVDATPNSIAIDATALQHALEEIERKKLDALSNDELLRSAHITAKSDVDASIRRLRALLSRPLSAEERSEALTNLGMHLRTRGTASSLAESAQLLQSVVDTAGFDSSAGRGAAYQLIWTYEAQKDTARGLALARSYVDSRGATEEQRAAGRWAAAILMHGSGDLDGARREYETLLRELGDAPQFTKLVADIQQRLARL